MPAWYNVAKDVALIQPSFAFMERVFLKKNLNAPRPSEHPPVWGEKCQNV